MVRLKRCPTKERWDFVKIEDILQFLFEKEGEYVSGEEMSQGLGVSRSAIWKGISTLREQGYEIDSKPNRGYCLQNSPVGIEKTKLANLLKEQSLITSVVCVPSIDSTNTEVKRCATQGAKEGLLVVAEHQTAGRGRRGRSFYSPTGKGLYFSLLLRPHVPYEELMDLTAWVAVAVSRGIAQYSGITPTIKWTNDILWEEKKISGILTEISLESESDFVDYVVVGVGINVHQKKEEFPEELREMAISLEDVTKKDLDRGALCASVVSSICEMYGHFPQEKQKYLQQYRELCVTVGKQVQVLKGENRRSGVATGIDDCFRLLVRYEDGEEEVLSTGEVSVRGMYGYI